MQTRLTVHVFLCTSDFLTLLTAVWQTFTQYCQEPWGKQTHTKLWCLLSCFYVLVAAVMTNLFIKHLSRGGGTDNNIPLLSHSIRRIGKETTWAASVNCGYYPSRNVWVSWDPSLPQGRENTSTRATLYYSICQIVKQRKDIHRFWQVKIFRHTALTGMIY